MLYEAVVPVGRVGFRLLFRLRVVGVENVPRHGAALICSNHCSYLDPMIAAVALPRRVYYASRKEISRQPVLGLVIRHLGAITLDREALADKSALQTMLVILDQGNLCLIYPEGTRSPDGKLQPARNGAAFLAVKSGVPVVPMAVIGSYECWPRQRRFARIGPITVRIGEAVTYSLPPERQSHRESLTAMTNDIMSRIRVLQEQGYA